ncbi:hypothetical protein HDU86_001936 [Geranomyces michiganensis]|nr:hypothetical protein HDU86_001936 [Geranomyces michiganensis]
MLLIASTVNVTSLVSTGKKFTLDLELPVIGEKGVVAVEADLFVTSTMATPVQGVFYTTIFSFEANDEDKVRCLTFDFRGEILSGSSDALSGHPMAFGHVSMLVTENTDTHLIRRYDVWNRSAGVTLPCTLKVNKPASWAKRDKVLCINEYLQVAGTMASFNEMNGEEFWLVPAKKIQGLQRQPPAPTDDLKRSAFGNFKSPKKQTRSTPSHTAPLSPKVTEPLSPKATAPLTPKFTAPLTPKSSPVTASPSPKRKMIKKKDSSAKYNLATDSLNLDGSLAAEADRAPAESIFFSDEELEAGVKEDAEFRAFFEEPHMKPPGVRNSQRTNRGKPASKLE